MLFEPNSIPKASLKREELFKPYKEITHLIYQYETFFHSLTLGVCRSIRFGFKYYRFLIFK